MADRIDNERGSVLVIALIMLVLLTVIGISASTNSSIELRISGNDKFHKMAFYAADGGTEAGCELLEQNIENRGFDSSTIGNAVVNNTSFWTNLSEPTNNDVQISNVGGHQVNLKFFGNTSLSSGGAIQLISGYEGKGKGASASGAYLVYDIKSQATGNNNTEARIHLRWRHVI